jgi:hypothetical protein
LDASASARTISSGWNSHAVSRLVSGSSCVLIKNSVTKWSPLADGTLNSHRQTVLNAKSRLR